MYALAGGKKGDGGGGGGVLDSASMGFSLGGWKCGIVYLVASS